MSSEPRPPLEFFLERSLGKLTGGGLREAGWAIHPIHEHFPNHGQETGDAEWIAFGCAQGWVCLTKDKRIRYRAAEIGALVGGHIFCMADGNLSVDEMVTRFATARPAIERAVAREDVGFWHVYEGGQVRRMWP